MPSVAAVMREVAEQLASAGIETARTEARWIVAEAVCGGDLTRIHTQRARELTSAELMRVQHIVSRRQARVPLQYVLGYTDFLGLRIACDERALIPRPETELLTETVIRAARAMQPAPQVAADIGAGSGAIAIGLAMNLPQLTRVYATDLSPAALALAEQNVRAHGLSERMCLLEGRDLEPLHAAGVAGQVEVLVTNPPYIGADELPGLQPEVRQFEPAMALVDASSEALGAYRRIIPQAGELPALRLFACEVGAGMAGDVEKLARTAWPQWKTRTIKDYSGFDRIVLAYAG